MAVALDIFSDPVCPWCHIGLARLDAALAERPGHPFQIAWHPFQLNPEMPMGGMDRRAYLEAKFGGRERAVEAYAPVEAAAAETGLSIAWDRIERVPNTLDAHRLIHWAGLEGVQRAAVTALFRAYFERGLDIGDRAVLLGIAGEAGLDPDVVGRLYDSGADLDEVAGRDAHARERGIDAVPTFIVGDRHAVPGAQPAELWLGVIDEIAAAPAGPGG